jgi:hypothetical protein
VLLDLYFHHHAEVPTGRFFFETAAYRSVKVSAKGVEVEIAHARATVVVLGTGKVVSGEGSNAHAEMSVDKARLARLDDELLWM